MKHPNTDASLVQSVLIDTPSSRDQLPVSAFDDLQIIEDDRILVSQEAQGHQLPSVFVRVSLGHEHLAVLQPGLLGLWVQHDRPAVLHQGPPEKVPVRKKPALLDTVAAVLLPHGVVDGKLLQKQVLQRQTGDFVIRPQLQHPGQAVERCLSVPGPFVRGSEGVPHQRVVPLVGQYALQRPHRLDALVLSKQGLGQETPGLHMPVIQPHGKPQVLFGPLSIAALQSKASSDVVHARVVAVIPERQLEIRGSRLPVALRILQQRQGQQRLLAVRPELERLQVPSPRLPPEPEADVQLRQPEARLEVVRFSGQNGLEQTARFRALPQPHPDTPLQVQELEIPMVVLPRPGDVFEGFTVLLQLQERFRKAHHGLQVVRIGQQSGSVELYRPQPIHAGLGLAPLTVQFQGGAALLGDRCRRAEDDQHQAHSEGPDHRECPGVSL